MPHVGYANPLCPWSACGFSFYQVDFRLELASPSLYQTGLLAWFMGDDLVGPCPQCGNLLAFNPHGIARVASIPTGCVLLPSDWFQRADILDVNGNLIRFSS